MRDCRKTPAADVLSLANSSEAMHSRMAKATGIIDARATTLVNGTAVDAYIPGQLAVCGVVITTTYKTALLTYRKSIDGDGHDKLLIFAGVDFPGEYPLLSPSDIPILQDPRPCRGNLEWGTAPVCTDREAGWVLPGTMNIKY